MARSDHPTYSAADRHERRATRRQQKLVRRSGTRSAVLRLAIAEVL